ncbi:hypothetical protein sS8_3752 [Methylocaldum marinum]|uniref:PAS domain-containing protein n=1 Tax=Methylocaldum marinum TaxID=1432792 RepID=A0A250L0W5_9GAMM|nr:hypothetical protein sS8_3752 [Methylocaldum marinum]
MVAPLFLAPAAPTKISGLGVELAVHTILTVLTSLYVFSGWLHPNTAQSTQREHGELLEQRIVGSTRQIAEERGRFESILTNMQDAVWSLSPDGGKVLFVNKAVENIYGCKPEEFCAGAPTSMPYTVSLALTARAAGSTLPDMPLPTSPGIPPASTASPAM